MCNELASEGIKEPHYNLIAFILKATVLARIVDENGLENCTGKDLKGLKRDLKRDLKGLKRDVNEREKSVQDILEVLRVNPTASYTDLSKECNISIKLVRTILSELKESHIIIRVGPKRGGTWKIESDK
jgi:ATP-dependent DNA helicase RecG